MILLIVIGITGTLLIVALTLRSKRSNRSDETRFRLIDTALEWDSQARKNRGSSRLGWATIAVVVAGVVVGAGSIVLAGRLLHEGALVHQEIYTSYQSCIVGRIVPALLCGHVFEGAYDARFFDLAGSMLVVAGGIIILASIVSLVRRLRRSHRLS